MTTKKDYYEVLGIEKSSDGTVIKKAFRKLAVKYHPDRNPDDAAAEQNFKEASEAYEVLSDDQKRSVYDQYGHAGLSGQGYEGFSNTEDIFSNFGSIFEDLFGFSGGGGFGGGRQRVQKGSDLRYDLKISFKEAILGVEKDIDFRRGQNCEECKGSGVEKGKTPLSCSDCNGQGQVRRSQGFFSVSTTCPSCKGTGAIIKDPCAGCRGSGQTTRAKKLNVKVPAGVDDGVRLRITGEGEDSPGGAGPAGDLYVFLNVESNKDYIREDQNIVYQLPISIAQAALGVHEQIPLVDGEKELEIPAGTQHGTRINIKGKGAPSLRGGRPGDFFVEVLVVVPEKLSKTQRELLEKFAEEDKVDYHKKKSSIFDRIFS